MKKTAIFFTAIFFSVFAAAAVEPELEQAEAAEPSPVEETTDGAKSSAWKFELETRFGARVGVYDEIVWASRKIDGQRYKRSELNYELTPAFYVGFDVSVSYKRFELKLAHKVFFSQECGTLTDSDWQNDDFCSNGDIYTQTDWSEHKLFLSSNYGGFAGFDIEAQGSYKFYPVEFLTLAPLVSFNAQHMGFEAKGGVGRYGLYDASKRRIASYCDPVSSMVSIFEDKPVVRYDVFNLFLWTGVRAEFKINSWLNVNLASEIAPVSLFFDFDQHLSNDRDFKEFAFSAFYAFRQTIKTEFKIKKNLSICQTCVFLFTGECEGSMYYKHSSEDSYSKLMNNTGGGQTIFLDLELSAKIKW